MNDYSYTYAQDKAGQQLHLVRNNHRMGTMSSRALCGKRPLELLKLCDFTTS